MEHTPTPRLVILLKAARGYHLVDVRTILYAEADSRHSCMHFTDGTKKVVFHTLTELEGILSCGKRVGELLFLRVHKSYLAGLHHTAGVERAGSIELVGGRNVPVSRAGWKAMLIAISVIQGGYYAD